MAAARLGVVEIILGIGGSATVDGGIGCAQACGLPVILDGGEPVAPTEPLCGRDIDSVVLIKHGRGSPVERVKLTVACDVTNPLFGPNGAARVFGPQKGATAGQVAALDDSLERLARRTGHLEAANMPGAGAAGGLGFGMLAFFGATLRGGVGIVLDAVNFSNRLRGADLCITGEGRLDGQSMSGKAPVGVARLCRDQRVACIALAGSIGDEVEGLHAEGLTDWSPLHDGALSLEESMRTAAALLEQAAERTVAKWLAGRQPLTPP